MNTEIIRVRGVPSEDAARELPMQPYQRRVLALRDNFSAYDAFYLALAESLGMPMLTDDRKFERALGPVHLIETWS